MRETLRTFRERILAFCAGQALLPSTREMTKEDLERILDAHYEWLSSGGKSGKRAELENARFGDIGETLAAKNLRQANFRGANLKKHSLRGSIFEGADFRGADLSGANLRDAVITDADFRDANLEGAIELENIRHFSGFRFGGANLDGVRLPGEISQFEGLAVVEEASKNARKLFLAMLLGCVYSWLTIATTTDARLLTNSASSPLPIIQTPIPIVGFYWVTPLLLLGIYIYFHLHMQRLWEGLAELPAVFPDGRPLDKKAYPWLLLGLVRAHFQRLRDDRPPLSGLQNWVSILLAWWVVPATLFLFWLRYLTRHDWVGTGVHIVLLVVSVVGGIGLHRLASATLRGDERRPFQWKKALKDTGTFLPSVETVMIVPIVCVFSFGAIGGVPPDPFTRLKSLEWEDLFSGAPPVGSPPDLEVTGPRRWVPLAFALVGYYPFAELAGADVSTKPPNWTGTQEKEKQELPLVKGAQLRGADLRHAYAVGVFLVKAHLQGADLRGAYLVSADLRGADLRGADLRRAHLDHADASGANLSQANLQGAFLWKTNLKGALLDSASFKGAYLIDVDLRQAYLAGANLFGADLHRTDLQGVNLIWAKGLGPSEVRAAKNWDLAFYSPDFAKKLGLPPDHNERVKKKLSAPKKEKEARAAKP